MKISDLIHTPWAKSSVQTALAVFAALVVYKFMDVIWFAIVVGAVIFGIHYAVSKNGGFAGLWKNVKKFLEIDLT